MAVTGFKAKVAVNDDGNGAAVDAENDSVALAGLTTLALPEMESTKFNATELGQVDGTSAVDPYERERPTGLITTGVSPCSAFYTKSNYQRLQSLLKNGAAGNIYTFVVTAPDDKTAGTPTVLTSTRKGWVSKVGQIVFEKENPVAIPFEITWSEKGTDT